MVSKSIDAILVKHYTGSINAFEGLENQEDALDSDQAKAELKSLILSELKETPDEPEIYWGKGKIIIRKRIERLFNADRDI